MIDFYEYGDLKVEVENLHNVLINRLGTGEYSTSDIVSAYKGTYENDMQIALGLTWDAYFGEILKQCEGRTGGMVIKELNTGDRNEDMETTLWEVY